MYVTVRFLLYHYVTLQLVTPYLARVVILIINLIVAKYTYLVTSYLTPLYGHVQLCTNFQP